MKAVAVCGCGSVAVALRSEWLVICESDAVGSIRANCFFRQTGATRAMLRPQPPPHHNRNTFDALSAASCSSARPNIVQVRCVAVREWLVICQPSACKRTSALSRVHANEPLYQEYRCQEPFSNRNAHCSDGPVNLVRFVERSFSSHEPLSNRTATRGPAAGVWPDRAEAPYLPRTRQRDRRWSRWRVGFHDGRWESDSTWTGDDMVPRGRVRK